MHRPGCEPQRLSLLKLKYELITKLLRNLTSSKKNKLGPAGLSFYALNFGKKATERSTDSNR